MAAKIWYLVSRMTVVFCLAIGHADATETVPLAEFLKMNHPKDDVDPRYIEFLEASLLENEVACSYKVTSTSSDQTGVQVEHYSPETGWELLSVDGDEPSKHALADYAQEAGERPSRGISPTSRIYVGVALSGTVQVDQEDEETIEFAFTPQFGEDAPDEATQEIMEKMNWRLIAAKDGMRPLSMVMSLDEPMSPMRGVKLLTFEQEFHFMKDGKTGATLIKSMRMKAKVRAFLLMRVTQEEQLEFSDFDCDVASAKGKE